MEKTTSLQKEHEKLMKVVQANDHGSHIPISFRICVSKLELLQCLQKGNEIFPLQIIQLASNMKLKDSFLWITHEYPESLVSVRSTLMIAFKDALAISGRQFAVASAHHKMEIHRSLEVFDDAFGDFARLFAEELLIRNGKYCNLLTLLRSIAMEFSESRKMENKCPSPSCMDQRRRSVLLLACIAQQVSHIAKAKPGETLDIDIILLIDRALVRAKTFTKYYCCEISDECADNRLESLFGPIEYLAETEAGMLMDSGLKLMKSIDDVIDVFASLDPNVVEFSDLDSRIRATAKRCFRAYTAVKVKYMLTI